MAVPTVAGEASRAGTGQGGDDPGGGGYGPDPIVRVVGDEEVAGGVDSDCGRGVEVGGSGCSTVAGKASRPGAGQGGDDPGGGGHGPDPVVRAVGDEEVAGGVDSDAGRRVEVGGGCCPTVAGKASRPGAGYDGYGRGATGHAAYSVSTGDEEVAGGVNGDAGRIARR